ncbi:MAG: 16S rRNA (cytidine(1402)-2'-O)-methyltransferase [Clostridia bacterium]|nr:16S rRNA (cytidine(1402)-2'-O)-methyltransferase [Clostridia bacterium]
MSELYVVATPIGNLNDMTFRAIDILNECEIIVCEDTRTSQVLLNHYDIKSKLVSYHKFNEDYRSDNIIEQMLAVDLKVGLITDAGTPCISDPGSYIVAKARENDIPVFAIPGASAVISALSVSGLSFVEFSFLGFFPREKKEQKKFLTNMEKSTIDTFVIYESPKRIIETLTLIKEKFEDLKVICCNDLTKKFEHYTYGKINEVIEELGQNKNSNLGEYAIVMQKPLNTTQNESLEYSLEAILVDDMVKNGGTVKDSINRLKEKYPKNELYNASLNLKNLF